MRTPQPARSATVRAMLLVFTGSLGMQVGAAISWGLFPTFGPAATSALRMLIAAVCMLLIFRPRLRGWSRSAWAGIVLYGIAMAAMNMLLYQAIDRLPLGVATTLDFLGPCTVALLASRRVREGLFAVAAFSGVVLMVGLGGDFDPVGVGWGLLAGASFAGYTLLAPRIGQSGGGMQSVALAVTVAALITLPFSAPQLPHVMPAEWGLLASSALAGTAVPFIVDTIAGRITSARVLGVFFAFDPLLGTIVGAMFLGQVLTFSAVCGILLVVVAGAGIVWSAGARGGVSAGSSAGAGSGSGSSGDAQQEHHVQQEHSADSVPARQSGEPRTAGEPGAPEAAGAPGQPGTPGAPDAPGAPRETEDPVKPTRPADAQGAARSIEIERKYEVPYGATLPAAEQFAIHGLTPGEAAVHELHARYFDTASGALAAQRIAVRVRRGGPDEGWHVKQQGASGTEELHWPLSGEMPVGLVSELERRIGAAAREVGLIAELRTERRTLRLEDAHGIEVVELADDRVRAAEIRGAKAGQEASGSGATEVLRAWREWEAELMPGADAAWLDAVETVLLESGAEPSPSTAKVARASGALIALARARGAGPELISRLQEMDRNDREAARRLQS